MMRYASSPLAAALVRLQSARRKKKGAEAPFSRSSLRSPLIPVVPMVPAAIPPAAVIMRMPVVPTAVSPTTVAVMPVMPAAVVVRVPVMRMIVTVTVVMTMPAMAPFVADVIGLLDVRSLVGLTGNGDRHRRCRRSSEGNAAKCGETNKCRSKFHDVHLLTSVGGGQMKSGSVHYRGLTPMNNVNFPQ